MAPQNIPVEPARFPKLDTSAVQRAGLDRGCRPRSPTWPTLPDQGAVKPRSRTGLEPAVEPAHKVNPRHVKPPAATPVTQRQLVTKLAP